MCFLHGTLGVIMFRLTLLFIVTFFSLSVNAQSYIAPNGSYYYSASLKKVSSDAHYIAGLECESEGSRCSHFEYVSGHGENYIKFQAYYPNEKYDPNKEGSVEFYPGKLISVAMLSCSIAIAPGVSDLPSCKTGPEPDKCEAYAGETTTIYGQGGTGIKQVCVKDRDCKANLQAGICWGEGTNECSFEATFTGESCDGTEGDLPPPITSGFCDTPEATTELESFRKACESKGGTFTGSCDADTQKIIHHCELDSTPPEPNPDPDAKEVVQAINDVKSSINSGNETLDKIHTSTVTNTGHLEEIKTELTHTREDVVRNLEFVQENITNQTSAIAALTDGQNALIGALAGDVVSVRDAVESNTAELGEKLDGIQEALASASGGEGTFDGLTQEQLKGVLDGYKQESEAKGTELQGLLDEQRGAVDSIYSEIDNILNDSSNPLDGQVFSNPLENVFNSNAADKCPTFQITIFGVTGVIEDHCRALDVLNKFLVIVMWAWCGIAIFNDAKVIYLRVTTGV